LLVSGASTHLSGSWLQCVLRWFELGPGEREGVARRLAETLRGEERVALAFLFGSFLEGPSGTRSSASRPFPAPSSVVRFTHLGGLPCRRALAGAQFRERRAAPARVGAGMLKRARGGPPRGPGISKEGLKGIVVVKKACRNSNE
jgi:hypothetical protein